MDSFEKYLKNKQKDLEALESFNKQIVWLQMNQRKERRKLMRTYIWPIAAAITVALGMAFYSIYQSRVDHDAFDISLVNSEMTGELKSLEAEFLKKASTINLEQIDKQEFSELFSELNTLDSLKTQTSEEIPLYGSNEDFVRILIRYYERKIRLLEILQKEIDKKQYDEELIQKI